MTQGNLDLLPNLETVRKGKGEREVLNHVEDLFDRAKKIRLQFERQWYVNLAFYFGKQYVQWASTALGSWSKLHEPAAPPWRVRLVSNKIRPIIRAELAKVTKEKPTGFVIPASSDDDDLFAARAGEHIFEHLWTVLKFGKVLRQTEFWTMLCGTAFLKDWYDPKKRDPSGVEGAICVERISPFHLWVLDMQTEDIEDQPVVIHGLAKDPDWVEQVFKKRVPPDALSSGGLLEQKFMSALGITDQNQQKRYVSVKEAWIKPSKRFPEGAVVVWAGETLLGIQEGWPYRHGEYPFTKFDHIPTGRFYADSTIPDLIPLQKEYNRTRSQIIEAKNRMSKPQLVAPRGSVDPNKITSEPGLIVFYTPGYNPPQPIPLVPIPNYVIEELDRCQRDMDDISSQHEVTRGRTPPGVTAATAISYLQEEDDSKLAATIASLEEGVEKAGKHFLSHVQQFWDAQRLVKVTGENEQFDAFMFGKADIRGNTDFRVEAGSAAPRSLAAKQAFITELGKLGWIPPQRALRYLGMGETNKLYEELQIDARHAQRENLRLSQGDSSVTVNTWDDHYVHVIEHNNERKRQKFEALPDDVKQLFEAHVTQHLQVIAMEQGQQFPPGDPRLYAFIRGVGPMVAQLGSGPGPGGGATPSAALGPGGQEGGDNAVGAG